MGILNFLTYLSCIIFLLFLIFVLLFYKWYSWSFYRKCQKLPSPKLNFITGFGMQLSKIQPDELLPFIGKLWQDLGNVMYFHIMGWTTVFLMNAEDIEILFNSTKYITKGNEYLILTPWMGDGLLTSTGDKWHGRRKQLTPSFHFQILENYIPVFNRHATNLIRKLNSMAVTSETVEISPLISSLTLDTICETTMGTALYLLSEDAVNYVTAIKRLSDITLTRTLTFWMFNDWLFNLSPIGREYNKHLTEINSFVEKVINQRKNAYHLNDDNGLVNKTKDDDFGIYKQKKSFLDQLIHIQRENPEIMTDKDILDEVNTFMFEGHDTIASAITWTLFMLATYSEIQDKVRVELNEIFGNDDREISMKDLLKMQYLEMVIKETLRLYPSVPYLTRKIPVDLHLKEYIIPAEANVAVMPYLVHRNPDVYTDPEKFDPNRFLPENARNYHPYAYLPFSAGYRNCIGQRFAMMEAKVMLSSVLRNVQIFTNLKREQVKVIPSVVLRANPQITLFFKPIDNAVAV